MTAGAPDGWSVDTLRQYVLSLIDQHDQRYKERFEAQNAQLAAALASAERAVEKAELATEKRFIEGNNYRADLDKQQRTFMPRLEAEGKFAQFTSDITALTSKIERQEGRGAGASVGWGYAVGAVGLIGLVIAIIMQFVK
jgi:hypothetical protein